MIPDAFCQQLIVSIPRRLMGDKYSCRTSVYCIICIPRVWLVKSSVSGAKTIWRRPDWKLGHDCSDSLSCVASSIQFTSALSRVGGVAGMWTGYKLTASTYATLTTSGTVQLNLLTGRSEQRSGEVKFWRNDTSDPRWQSQRAVARIAVLIAWQWYSIGTTSRLMGRGDTGL